MNDHELVLEIQQLMDGVEWSADTLDAIAQLLISNGYRIRDMNDYDLEEAT